MSRFTDAIVTEHNLIDAVIKDSFPELIMARFIVLFDEKKRKSKGSYVVGRIKKLNDETKALSQDPNGDEYNYVIFLDKFVWNHLDDADKTRIMRRLLCQCDVDGEAADDIYKIQGFEVEDFNSELIKNQDDPQWLYRVNLIAESLYDNEGQDLPEGD